MSQSRGSLPALTRGQGCALWGAVFAAMSTFVFWYVLGPAAIALGVVAVVRGEPRGRWVVVAGAVCMLVGLGLSLLPDRFVTT
jgi:hypothetical protein